MEDQEPEASNGPKKKCANEDEWRRNVVKRARLEGLEYVDYKNRIVPAVTTGPPCGCKENCTVRLTEQAEVILARLWSMGSKNEQDAFLQSLISCHDVERHRPRKLPGEGARAAHEKSFCYHVMVGECKEGVCLSAFASLHGIKVSRIRRLRRLLLAGQFPEDRRGQKAGTNAIPEATRRLIREHVEDYLAEEEKASNSSSSGKTVRFLKDSGMTITMIYRMFADKHPEVKCSYKFFAKFVKENFELRFGPYRP